MWIVKFTSNAEKDKKFLKQSGLDSTAKKLLNILMQDPYKNPPSYEKLIGDLNGYYSRRINRQHRIVYQIIKEEKTIIVHSL